MTTMRAVECIGGPMDGETPTVDLRSKTVRFPSLRGEQRHYTLVMLPDGTPQLHWLHGEGR